MIYLLYLLVAASIVFLSSKASFYVDQIERKTNLSGAFIGGVMLSAVTSLPELFTSISSALFLNEPGLCLGNILGSNIFNMAVLSILILVFLKGFSNAKVSKSHITVILIVTLIYVAVVLNMLKILSFEIFTVNITSVIVIVLYIFGVRYMSAENGSEKEEKESSPLSLKTIIIRFSLTAVGIIALSIAITYITDNIAEKLNLGAGLAGALFLGIATSLPEVSSSISLFKMKNYNIALGNIIGSNIFNLFILGFTDLIYVGGGLYNYSDPKTVNLLVFGTAAAFLLFLTLKFKNKISRIIFPTAAALCYIAALAV